MYWFWKCVGLRQVAGEFKHLKPCAAYRDHIISIKDLQLRGGLNTRHLNLIWKARNQCNAYTEQIYLDRHLYIGSATETATDRLLPQIVPFLAVLMVPCLAICSRVNRVPNYNCTGRFQVNRVTDLETISTGIWRTSLPYMLQSNTVRASSTGRQNVHWQ